MGMVKSASHVRVPITNSIGGAGQGFEIAQGRLGPGRIHHCMRCIGAAEKSLELMIDRGDGIKAFGQEVRNWVVILNELLKHVLQ